MPRQSVACARSVRRRRAGAASAGCHDAQPGDAADTDAVSAPAGREADVGLGAERALDDARPGQAGQRRSSRHASQGTA